MYLLDVILHEAQTLDGNLVRPPLQQPLHPSLCRLQHLHGLRNIRSREELEHANGQVEADGVDDPRGVKVRLQCSGETVQAGRVGRHATEFNAPHDSQSKGGAGDGMWREPPCIA